MVLALKGTLVEKTMSDEIYFGASVIILVAN